MSVCRVVQYSRDGLGHQLEGMLQLMSMDNRTIGPALFRYDACTSVVTRQVEHSNTVYTQASASAFLAGAERRLCSRLGGEEEKQQQGRRIGNESGNATDKLVVLKSKLNLNGCSSSTVFGVDNAFEKVPFSRNVSHTLLRKRERLRSIFLPLLPPPHFTPAARGDESSPRPRPSPRAHHNVVVHLRQTDLGHITCNVQLKEHLSGIVARLREQLGNETHFYIHSDAPVARVLGGWAAADAAADTAREDDRMRHYNHHMHYFDGETNHSVLGA